MKLVDWLVIFDNYLFSQRAIIRPSPTNSLILYVIYRRTEVKFGAHWRAKPRNLRSSQFCAAQRVNEWVRREIAIEGGIIGVWSIPILSHLASDRPAGWRGGVFGVHNCVQGALMRGDIWLSSRFFSVRVSQLPAGSDLPIVAADGSIALWDAHPCSLTIGTVLFCYSTVADSKDRLRSLSLPSFVQGVYWVGDGFCSGTVESEKLQWGV